MMKIRNANKHNIEYRESTWWLVVDIYFRPKFIAVKVEDPYSEWLHLIRTL